MLYLHVSILVVMDAVLRQAHLQRTVEHLGGLNPCCNGCCSQTLCSCFVRASVRAVSILVVMDAVLRLVVILCFKVTYVVSILVVMDAVLRLFSKH